MQARTTDQQTVQRVRAVQSPMSKALIICDVCHGVGFVSAMLDGPRGPAFTELLPCPECSGNGAIPEERLEFRLRGDDCRQIRIDMHRTIADVAGFAGFTIAYVDRMERGLNNPEPLEKYWGLAPCR